MTERNMIAAVTLNPAVDKTIVVPNFAVGKMNRGQIDRLEAGGKGINVAKAAKQLGCPVMACGFLAGSNGRFISESLAAQQIPADFIWLPGETRVNLKIKDPIAGTETEINEPGFQVGPAHLDQLRNKIKENANPSVVMVFCGRLPPGASADTYADLIRIAKDRGARTVLDTDGEALRLGLAAQPDLIKPNRAEVEELLQTKLEREPQLVWAARELTALGSGSVAISLGPEGAVAASGGHVWRASAPAIKARGSVGAGDSMVAAFAWAMMKGLPFPEALRLAVAAGSASAATWGSNVPELKLIQELLPQVEIEEFG